VKGTALMVALGLVVAGCGGGAHGSSLSMQSQPNVTTTAAPATTSASASTQRVSKEKNTRQTLGTAVRASLLANHRLSIRVLWTNQVPAAATNSIGGPALAGLRASAKDRQRKGVRVRMLHDRYRILSISLAPSLTRATAVAESIQTVSLTYLNGHPRGRSVRLDERARISLRRLGTSDAFIIWSVALLK
jgi:hypothetical protein